jgi:hypothetical protein
MTGTTVGASIATYHNVQQTDMAAFVYANGPLSIAVDAESWQTYQGGIMTNCASGQLDHGVLIVGYDDTSDPVYWIIKNSWGASWGENGYIRVQKDANQCSIGQYQTSAVVNGAGPTSPPSPPTPTATPAPGPSPAGGFVQKTCTDPQCQNCESQSFPQNQCIQRHSASYIATCDTNSLNVKEYASTDCSGAYREQAQPTDVCAIVFQSFDAQEFVQVSCTSAPPPAPTTTAPAPTTTAPAPTPAPAAYFEQMQCSDAACSQNCQSQEFPQNTCLQLSSGGSATAACTATALVMTAYQTSDCTGANQVSPQPINTCTADQQGTYFENICSNSTLTGKKAGAAMKYLF